LVINNDIRDYVGARNDANDDANDYVGVSDDVNDK
jgi:hypothetical protein